MRKDVPVSSGPQGDDRQRRNDDRPYRDGGRGGSPRRDDRPPYRGDRDSGGGSGRAQAAIRWRAAGQFRVAPAPGGHRGDSRSEGGFRSVRRVRVVSVVIGTPVVAPAKVVTAGVPAMAPVVPVRVASVRVPVTVAPPVRVASGPVRRVRVVSVVIANSRGGSREGGFRSGPRDGAGGSREGGFRSGPRDGGASREGGFRSGPPREGGFGGDRDSRGGSREGGFRSGPRDGGGSRDGGYRWVPVTVAPPVRAASGPVRRVRVVSVVTGTPVVAPAKVASVVAPVRVASVGSPRWWRFP